MYFKKGVFVKIVGISCLFFMAPFSQTEAAGCIDLGATAMRFGSRDFATAGKVSLLQGHLNDKGFLAVEPTGYFGPMTFQAVKDFQTAGNLPSTGFVGVLTRALIKDLSCEKVQDMAAVPTLPSQVVSVSEEPSITVLSPNGGETWVLGKENVIQWSGAVSGTVQLYLQFPDGGTCNIGFAPAIFGELKITLRSDDCPNLGQQILPGQYKIALILHKYADKSSIGIARDYGDDYFSITSY